MKTGLAAYAAAATAAGTFHDRPVVSVDSWGGGKRTIFTFDDGRRGWFVEPEKPLPGRPWVWTTQWMGAYLARTGAPDLVKAGWTHVHLEAFDTRCDDKGLDAMDAFQTFLVNEVGLAPKACLIGMSWGGFYAVRYADAHPDAVAAIYLDAPLLSFDRFGNPDYGRIGPWAAELPESGIWRDDPRMPVCMAESLLRARIPLLLLYGGQDQTVPPAENAELFAARYREAAARLSLAPLLTIERRDLYGHHPHGVEESETGRIVSFFEKAISEKN